MEELLVSWSNKQREHINRPVLWNRVKGESSKLCATNHTHDLHKRLSLRVTIIMSIGEITKCAGERVDMSTHSFIRSLNVASGWPEPAIQPTAINFNKSNYLPTIEKQSLLLLEVPLKMGLGFTRAHHLWSCYHENASQLWLMQIPSQGSRHSTANRWSEEKRAIQFFPIIFPINI